MTPKHDNSFTIVQVKEILSIHEKTIMNFFNSTIERLEKKIDNVVMENTNLKNEIKEVRSSIQFHSDFVDEKVKEHNEKIKSLPSNADIEEFREKVAELEDRGRRNNLRLNGIEEDEDETSPGSEVKIKQVLKNLGIKSTVQIERGAPDR